MTRLLKWRTREDLSKVPSNSRVFYILLLIVVLAASSCNQMAIAITPTSFSSVDSALRQQIIGKWKINHGRIGNSILEFHEDGALTITNVDNGDAQILEYVFIEEDVIVLVGESNLAGTAKIEFKENKLWMVITFDDNVLGDIYPPMQRLK